MINNWKDVLISADEAQNRAADRFDGCSPQIYTFPQRWSTDALGFTDVMANNVFTTAQTSIFSWGTCAMVYFGNKFAYEIEEPNAQFYRDLKYQEMKHTKWAYTYSSSKKTNATGE